MLIVSTPGAPLRPSYSGSRILPETCERRWANPVDSPIPKPGIFWNMASKALCAKRSTVTSVTALTEALRASSRSSPHFSQAARAAQPAQLGRGSGRCHRDRGLAVENHEEGLGGLALLDDGLASGVGTHLARLEDLGK